MSPPIKLCRCGRKWVIVRNVNVLRCTCGRVVWVGPRS